MSPDPRTEAFGALASFLVSDASLADTLTRIAEITTDALPAAAFAGMTLLDEQEQPTTGIFTSAESPEIDQAQYETGEGPCLDAWRRGETVSVDDTARDGPYPAFRALALRHGIRSTLSLPLVASGASLGALNLYSREVSGFTDVDRQVGNDLVKPAGALIANSRAYWGAFDLGQQLGEAMKSRSVIEQAKGVLMAKASDPLDADGAFALLKQASQRENVKIRDIAARIIEQRQL